MASRSARAARYHWDERTLRNRRGNGRAWWPVQDVGGTFKVQSQLLTLPVGYRISEPDAPHPQRRSEENQGGGNSRFWWNSLNHARNICSVSITSWKPACMILTVDTIDG